MVILVGPGNNGGDGLVEPPELCDDVDSDCDGNDDVGDFDIVTTVTDSASVTARTQPPKPPPTMRAPRTFSHSCTTPMRVSIGSQLTS